MARRCFPGIRLSGMEKEAMELFKTILSALALISII
jgi:hypothetical protein